MRSGLLSAAFVTCSVLLAGPALAQGVKIGILNDQSGVYADYGGKYSVEAAKMAVEDFGGKVDGRPIEIIFADHLNKADVGANMARQWVETAQRLVEHQQLRPKRERSRKRRFHARAVRQLANLAIGR